MTKRMRQLIETYQSLVADGFDDAMILKETGWSASALVSVKAALQDSTRRTKRADEERTAARETASILRREEQDTQKKAKREEILAKLEQWDPATKEEFGYQWRAGTALGHLAVMVAMPEEDIPLVAKELGLKKKDHGKNR